MKRAAENKLIRRPLAVKMAHRLREGLLIISIALAAFLLISFCTFHSTDPGWSNTGIDNAITNWGGRVGAWLADVFLSLFGLNAYFFLPLMVFAAWVGIKERSSEDAFKLSHLLFKALGFILIIISGCGLVNLSLKHPLPHLPASAGGILGDLVASGLTHTFNLYGSFLFLIAAALCGITLFTGFSWLGLVDALGWNTMRLCNVFKLQAKRVIANALASKDKKSEKNEVEVKVKKLAVPRLEPVVLEREPVQVQAPIVKKPPVAPPKKVKTESTVSIEPGALPPLSLLNPPAPSEGKAFSNVTFEDLSQLVEQRLSDFGVEAKVVAVLPGPLLRVLNWN